MLFKNFIDILVSPGEAFRRLRERPHVLVPLLLLLLASASIQFGYFSFVDHDYMVDDLVEQAQAFTTAPEEQLRAAYENQSTQQLAITSAVSTVLVTLLIFALYAGWLTLFSKLGDDGINFRRWFSLAIWTSVPTLLAVLAAWVVLLTSPDGEISLQDIAPLRISSLLGLRDAGPWAALDLTQVWALVLLVLGHRQWSGRSPGASALIVLSPVALLLGVFTLLA